MRILIVYANRLRMLAPAPLGAALVADRLRRDGHEVRLLDLMFAPSATRAVADAVRAVRPDLIGFSLRNRDNQSAAAYYDALPPTRAIVAAARAVAPAAIILLGGTAFTTFPAAYLRELDADFGYCGDEVEPIARFVASLAAGAPDHATPGLVYRQGDGSAIVNPFSIKGYGDDPFTCWDLIEYRPYRRSFTSISDAAVVTRTGCPFECVFCDTFRTFGREWRLRDPEAVAQDVLTLRRKHGVRSVWLADGGFNRPLEHAKAVLEAIIRSGAKVRLESVFEPGEVDAEFVRLYRKAGGLEVMVFASSLAPEVLAAQRKPFQVEDVFRGATLLNAGGVAVAVSLMLGGPGETPATLNTTRSQAGRLKALYTWAEYGFRPMPGTELTSVAAAEGLVPRGYDCFAPVFYFSSQTPPSLLAQQVKELNAANPVAGGAGLPWLLSLAAGKAAAWLQ